MVRLLLLEHGRYSPFHQTGGRKLKASDTRVWAVAAFALLLGGCGQSEPKGGGGRGGPGQGTPEVGYVVVQPTSAAIEAELSGRTSAFESSDVRPQVSGIIRRRFFTEGTYVRQGQPLYEVDPSLYRAAVAQASANVSAAQASAQAAQTQAARYAPLARIEAISQQEYTNAVAQVRQGTAQVAQNRAALETAQINLKFTTVPAPISGRIGRSLFTVGALVSASQAEPLAQIQRLDPMFVDIQQSSSDMLALRRSLTRDGVVPATAQVRLQLEDDSIYPNTGSIQFAEGLVSTSTGTVTLRARFPNPQGILLPGMFVRARFTQAVDQTAFLVPQQAVSRDPQGRATVFVVGADNKAALRPVTAERTQGAFWVVTDGLQPGDRVITQGLGKLLPNQQVKPVPATTPQRIQAPPAGKGPPAGGSGGRG